LITMSISQPPLRYGLTFTVINELLTARSPSSQLP